MISYIKGKMLSINREDKNITVEVLLSSGLGYFVLVPSNSELPKKGEEIVLFTSFQVRDDSQTLYGFNKPAGRKFFESLISVSGIGPKIGLAILSTYSMRDLQIMIASGDHKSLSRVSGLGSKGSQKIVLELQSKYEDMKGAFGTAGESKHIIDQNLLKELKAALRSLGFSGKGLNDAVEKGETILRKDTSLGIEDLIKKVLLSND